MGALLAAGLILLDLTATPVFAATLSMSPSHGQAGTRITLSGTDFKPSATVTISFGGQVQTAALTDLSGTFNVVFTAPSMPAGTYWVTADDGTNSVSVPFRLDPGTTTTTSSTTSTTSSSTSSTTTTATTSSTPTPKTTTTTETTTVTTTAVSTVTTSRPATTVTETKTLTQVSVSPTTSVSTLTTKGAEVTTTSTVTQPGAPTTVTVTEGPTASGPGAGLAAPAQSAPQGLGAITDTSLYFFAGVGVLILAISLGIMAFRGRVNEDYRKYLKRENEG